MISSGGPPRSCISPTRRAISLPFVSSENPGFRNVCRIWFTMVDCLRYLSRASTLADAGGFAKYVGYCTLDGPMSVAIWVRFHGRTLTLLASSAIGSSNTSRVIN